MTSHSLDPTEGKTESSPSPVLKPPLKPDQPSPENGENAPTPPPASSFPDDGVQLDTLREQLFRKERRLRNMLYVGGPATGKVHTVISPYSGPRMANMNRLCLRSWSIICDDWRGGDAEAVEEDEEEQSLPNPWYDDYASLFEYLQQEMLQLWNLEDVAPASVNIHLQFGVCILAANSTSRFQDLDPDLDNIVSRIQSSGLSNYFLTDTHPCLRAAVSGIDVEEQGKLEHRVQLTLLQKDKLSYLSALCRLIDLPDGGYKAEIQSLETSGVRCVWTVIALPEATGDSDDDEEEEDVDIDGASTIAETVTSMSTSKGKKKRRYLHTDHAMPFEVIFHCNAEKSLNHPSTEFLNGVMDAICLHFDALRLSARFHNVADNDAPPLTEVLRQMKLAFDASYPHAAPSQQNPDCMEDASYAITKIRIETFQPSLVRGIVVEQARAIVIDYSQTSAKPDPMGNLDALAQGELIELNDRNVVCTREVRVKWPMESYYSNQKNLEPLALAGSLCRYIITQANAERRKQTAEKRRKHWELKQEQKEVSSTVDGSQQEQCAENDDDATESPSQRRVTRDRSNRRGMRRGTGYAGRGRGRPSRREE